MILVTSKGDKVGDKFVDQLGVTGYITKPFQPEELVSKIHQTLEARQAQKEAGPVPSMPSAPSPVAESVEGVPQERKPAAPVGVSAPQAIQADSIKQIVQEELSQIFAREVEEKVQTMIKTELGKFVKNLDKRIEKVVIE